MTERNNHQTAALPLFIFLLLLAPAFSGQAATIEGIIFSPAGAAAGARVFAYSDIDLAADHLVAESEPDEAEGHYRLELENGRYYLVARAVIDGEQFFSFHGANPVVLDHDYYWLPFFLARSRDAICTDAGVSGIGGRITFAGRAVAGGVVSVYRWQKKKFRGMGLLSKTIDEDGSFWFDLDGGSYSIVARKRREGNGIGPLARGDLFCYPGANPVRLTSGKRCEIEIECYLKDDLERYLVDDAADPRGGQEKKRRRASLSERLAPLPSPEYGDSRPATISGRVTDPLGTPMAGMVVTAYPSQGQDIFQMHLLRLKSRAMARTGRDGRYSMTLERGEKYYLVAREKVGEAPQRNEAYGLYQGNANHSLTLGRGEGRSGVDIVAARIMPPRSETLSKKAENPQAAPEQKLFLNDQVIRHDTTWSGEVTINGVIVVAPGTKLTIAPGTRIRFKRVDRNHDGIGDGEIRVMGTIRAMGNREHPIIFASAEATPAVSDWSYLLLFASDGDNVISFCRFRDAFSGVQVHFSTATVRNNEFSGNNEGLRFGRADILIENNRFHDNHIGIRFTRMEGPAIIRGNLINANDTGIFLVPSGQNITDFFEPDRGGTPWNTGRLEIRGNIIAENLAYDLKLGEKQLWDLDARGNTWRLAPGMGDGPRIFDRKRDPELGKVVR